MSKATVYNLEGKSVGEVELNDAVFAVEVSPEVVQFAVSAQRANAHVPYAHTKGRSEMRGGGKKPWRQKGTGRARHGSRRSPIWRGGAVTFGPSRFRNMIMKINKKQKQAAIRMVLTDKANEKMLVVVDSFDSVDGKTSQIANALKALPVEGKSALIATGEKNAMLTRAAANIEKVNTVLADSVNTADLLRYTVLIVDQNGLQKMVERFS